MERPLEKKNELRLGFKRGIDWQREGRTVPGEMNHLRVVSRFSLHWSYTEVSSSSQLLSRLGRRQDSSRHGQQRGWESGHSGRASSLTIGPVLMSNTFNSRQHSNPASLRSSRRCCPCWETRAAATTARSFLISLCFPPSQNRTIGVRIRGGGKKSPFVFQKQLFL